MKRVVDFLFGRTLWCSRLGAVTLVTFLSLIWFVVDWCATTTFRPMSDWMLWAVNIAAAMLLTLPYLITRKVWLQGVVLLLLDLLLEANLMYCRTYFTGIPPESYMLAGNLGDFTASVADALRWMDAGFPVILFAGLTWVLSLPRAKAPGQAVRYLSTMMIPVVAVAVGLPCKGGFYREYDRRMESCYYSTTGVPTFTVGGHLLYHLLDRKEAASPERTAEVERWLAEHRVLVPLTALPDSVAPRRNLVVILLESLESWVVEADVQGKPITPVLDSLVRLPDTFYAPLMATQVGSGRSIDAQLLLTAGLMPMSGSVYSMKYPHSEYPSLPKALKEAYGARATILTCDKPITWNQEVIARSFGYDALIDRRHWENDEMVGNPPKLSDGSLMRQSVELLRKGELWPVGSPAMLTFVTYSGHNPFVLPDALKDPDFDISASGLPEKARDYITMAHYTDSKLRLLIDYLHSRPDYENTLVVITGDHEGLAAWRESLRSSSPEAASLISEGQYTPFIVLNSPVGGRIDREVGQIDMYPTLLEFLGLTGYRWHGQGQSMTHPVDTEAYRLHADSARRISDAIIRTDYWNHKLRKLHKGI